MKVMNALSLAAVGAWSLWTPVAPLSAQAQAPPTVAIPKPGVPQIMTLEGKFVRAAYNNEGYVILGYQLANRSIGEEWLLLEIGATVLDRVPDYKLTREAISLDTPDGKTIPLATVAEQRQGNTQALQNRERVQRDSINYFPPRASQACRIGFFADLDSRVLPFDVVELSPTRACLGRLYFRVPGGIAYGQHWLNVKFEKSLVRVPFRILTEAEEELSQKNYKAIDKQVEDAFKEEELRPVRAPIACSTTLVLIGAVVATHGLALAGLQPKYGVTVSASKPAALAKVKTYIWTITHPSFAKTIDTQIVAAIDRELQARGLRKLDSGPGDLSVTYRSLSRTDVDLKTETRGAASEFEVGTLIVDLRDPSDGSSLFRVRVDTPIERDSLKLDATIKAAVGAMFEKYPQPPKR